MGCPGQMKLDLKLLEVFDALFRRGSVTRAADAVGLTQSSTSNALQRLRTVFSDPLFVRSGTRMVPTRLACSIADSVRQTLAQVRCITEVARPFDAPTSGRVFKISVNDIGQLVFIPTLMAAIRKLAPRVCVETVGSAPHEVKRLLADGDVDLALGALDDFGPNYHRQRLFRDSIVCLISANHPNVRKDLSLHAYLHGTHGRYQPTGISHALISKVVERLFADHRCEPRVALRLAYMPGLGRVIESTDLIFTLSNGVASHIRNDANVRVVPAPFKTPRIEISQQWHHRLHQDPAHQWLRRQIAALFGKDPKQLY